MRPIWLCVWSIGCIAIGSIAMNMFLRLSSRLPSVVPMRISSSSVVPTCTKPVDYIVTGGCGFIGSRLVKSLRREHPRAIIKVVDNLWRGRLDNLRDDNGTWMIDVNEHFHLVDLTEPDKTRQVVRCAVTIYHLADIVAGIDFIFGQQPFVFRQNILINTNVMRASLEGGIQNYVYVGTACAFPKQLQSAYTLVALHENQTYPANPESAYGWSKLMGEYESMVQLRDSPGSMNISLLRFHNVYGAGMVYGAGSQAISALIRKAVNANSSFNVFGSGEQYRDFVYVDDIVEALMLCSKGNNRGVVQIGTGRGVRIRDVSAAVSAMTNLALKKDVVAHHDASGLEGDRGRVAVTERAARILGWKSKVNISLGLAKTFLEVTSKMLEQAQKGRLNDKLFPPAERFVVSALSSFVAEQRADPRGVLRRLIHANDKFITEVLPALEPPSGDSEGSVKGRRTDLLGENMLNALASNHSGISKIGLRRYADIKLPSDGAAVLNVDANVLPFSLDGRPEVSYVCLHRQMPYPQYGPGFIAVYLDSKFRPVDTGTYIMKGGDPRIFLHNGDVWIYTHKWPDAKGGSQAYKAVYIHNMAKNKTLELKTSLSFIGKNWSPFSYRGKLYFVYAMVPLKILILRDEKTGLVETFYEEKQKRLEMDSEKMYVKLMYRGGTPGIVVQDHYVFGVGHKTDKKNNHQQSPYLWWIDMSEDKKKARFMDIIPDLFRHFIFPVSAFMQNGSFLVAGTENDVIWGKILKKNGGKPYHEQLRVDNVMYEVYAS